MDDKKKFKLLINNLVCQFHQIKHKLKIIVVANKNNSYNNYIINRSIDSILHLCKKHDVEYIYFTEENEFIKYILSQRNIDKNTLIYNRSYKGTLSSRRILIPAFCSFNNLQYIGNDAYQMGLLCNKFHYYSVLKEMQIPVADFWCYSHLHGWITEAPPIGLKVIAKLSQENNATSLTTDSIFIYSSVYDSALMELSCSNNQFVVVQKFISGYEVTVPIFIYNNETIVPSILGLYNGQENKFGNEIITEKTLSDSLNKDHLDKYYEFDYLNPLLIQRIKEDINKIVNMMNIKSFSRFDLRIDDSFGYYFNDLGSIPGMLPNSAFAYIFKTCDLTYEDFLVTTISMNFKPI